MLPPNSNNAFTTSGIFMRFPQLERARAAVAPMGCRLFDRVGNGVARTIAIGRLLSATKAACKVVQRAGRSTIGGHLRQSRSEEHTSELQSRLHLVCRLLLEKT